MTNVVPRHAVTVTAVSNPILLLEKDTGVTNVGDYDYYARIELYFTNAISPELNISRVYDTNLNWFWCGEGEYVLSGTMNLPSAEITNVSLTVENGTNTAVYLIRDLAPACGTSAYEGTTNDVFGAVVFRSVADPSVNRAVVLGR
jgi:hypothetical protein